MPPRSAPLGRRRDRRAFTLVELIVALLLFSVGVLALASTALSVTRLLRGGQRQSRAAVTALARFDSLRGARCAALPAGAQAATTPDGMTERWRLDPDATSAAFASSASRVYDVVDTVSYQENTGPRAHVFRTAIQCLP